MARTRSVGAGARCEGCRRQGLECEVAMGSRTCRQCRARHKVCIGLGHQRNAEDLVSDVQRRQPSPEHQLPGHQPWVAVGHCLDRNDLSQARQDVSCGVPSHPYTYGAPMVRRHLLPVRQSSPLPAIYRTVLGSQPTGPTPSPTHVDWRLQGWLRLPSIYELFPADEVDGQLWAGSWSGSALFAPPPPSPPASVASPARRSGQSPPYSG
ncbi:unnamed protein product [Zymoseptoria tritici ST99CH_1E4]|uniref:Zn(2)-C6 fungal-type domain-containing protein n=1 Tax=Zymoseptoria tritici ST99CH_1E4 TaxID=1276532 RepID=A0A2H1HBZ0_ZYMTR|nr:unnamed protein product [Zymoseptoria tritici ST99CH_1E4]